MPTSTGADEPNAELLNRRTALARAAALLGSALAAPTIAAVLAGCGDRAASNAARAAITLQALSPSQEQLVAAVADVILPATNTPGARQVGVSQFIDRMLTEYSAAGDRNRVIAGLERLDANARRLHGTPFVKCTAEQQFALVDALDAQAYGTPAADAASRPAAAPRASAADAASAIHPDDIGPQSFFRLLKELTVVGYYTSEVGATRELRVNPMGRWRADVPYSDIGAGWS